METEEKVLPSELNEYIVKIVQKTRVHPEILRGVSPRGSLAFKELIDALKHISGNVTKEIIKKAALITLPHRIMLKPDAEKTSYEIIEEIIEEVFRKKSLLKTHFELSEKELKDVLLALWKNLNNPSFSDIKKNTFSLNEKFIKDLIEQNKIFKELKPKDIAYKNDLQFMKKLCELLKDKGYLTSKRIENEYSFTKKAIKELSEMFSKNAQIYETSSQSGKEIMKKPYNNVDKNLSLRKKDSLKNTFQFLNNIMDVQNTLLGSEVTLQDLYVNNILKSNFKKLQLEHDYRKLQVIIDNLKKEGFLKEIDPNSGTFCLTPYAIDFLLEYSFPFLNFEGNLLYKEFKKKCFDGEKIDIKKFSLGDVYRSLSIRHTLKEVVRKRKALKDIERKDLKVFVKKPKHGLSVVLALDISGSMAQKSKLKLAKLIAAGLIKIIINKGGKVALVTFNDSSEILLSYTNDKKLLLENLIKLKASRNTNIGEGIKDSIKISLKNDLEKNKKHIILITDGQPTATSKSALKDIKVDENSVLGEAYAIQEAKKARKHGIVISVIAIGEKNDKGLSFAKRLAKIGGGAFYKISSMEDLNTIMKCEIIRLNK